MMIKAMEDVLEESDLQQHCCDIKFCTVHHVPKIEKMKNVVYVARYF